MNVQLRIHPAIGIARVGTSADEYFLGPEIEDEPEPPVGGYRDSKGALKPQAARFRVFARIEDDGKVSWQEVTSAMATLTWSVQLRNPKATALAVTGAGTPRNRYIVDAGGNTTVKGATTTAANATMAMTQGGGPPDSVAMYGSTTFLAPAPKVPSNAQSTTFANEFGDKQGPPNDVWEQVFALGVAADVAKQKSDKLNLLLARVQLEPSGRLTLIGGPGEARHAFAKPGSPEAPVNTFDNWLWTDGTSDGTVRCQVELTPALAVQWKLPAKVDASPAWAIVGPPNFGRIIPPVVSGVDVIENRLATAADLLHDVPRFDRDILPLLRAAWEVRWAFRPAFAAMGHDAQLSPEVVASLGTIDPDPNVADAQAAARRKLFAVLSPPNSPLPLAVAAHYAPLLAEVAASAGGPGKANMPPKNLAPHVTLLQYVRMLKWAAGDFVPLGTPLNQAEPTTLDRASLRWLVGGVFAPGVEVCSTFLQAPLMAKAVGDGVWLQAADDRFRLDPQGKFEGMTAKSPNGDELQPGRLTDQLAVPWQTDFLVGCGTWLSARPRDVFVPQQGAPASLNWARGAAVTLAQTVSNWSELGVLRRAPDGFVYESERTLPEPGTNLAAWLQTPAIDFGVVHAGFFDGAPTRSYAARAIRVLGAGATGGLELSNLSLDGPAAVHATVGGYILMNTTLPVLAPADGLVGSQQYMQQLAAVTPMIPTAKDKDRVWLVYGTGLPTETPLLACTTAATAKVQCGNQSWSIPVVAATSLEPPAPLIIGLDCSASMAGHLDAARSVAAWIANVSKDHRTVVLYSFGGAQDQSVTVPAGGSMDGVKTLLAAIQIAPGKASLIGAVYAGASVKTAAKIKTVVLLTRGDDGKAPFVGATLPADVRVFGLGFGSDLRGLQSLCASTGGFTLAAPASTEEVLKVAGALQAEAIGLQMIVDPVVIVGPERPAELEFAVCSADEAIEVRWQGEGAEGMIPYLLAPGRIPVTATSLRCLAARGALVARFFPAQAVAETRPMPLAAGTWTAGLRWPKGAVERRDALSVTLRCDIAAASALHLRVDLVADSVDPTLASLAVVIEAYGVTLPAGRLSATLQSVDQHEILSGRWVDGTWTSIIRARAAGSHTIVVRAQGVAPDGTAFTREAMRSWSVPAFIPERR